MENTETKPDEENNNKQTVQEKDDKAEEINGNINTEPSTNSEDKVIVIKETLQENNNGSEVNGVNQNVGMEVNDNGNTDQVETVGNKVIPENEKLVETILTDSNILDSKVGQYKYDNRDEDERGNNTEIDVRGNENKELVEITKDEHNVELKNENEVVEEISNVDQVLDLDSNVITDLDNELEQVVNNVLTDDTILTENKGNEIEKPGEMIKEEVNIELKEERSEQQTESVIFREKKEKVKNKEKRVTFLEQNLEAEDFYLQNAKSNESKVVWEIVSETKGDEIVTEVKNERKKSEMEEYRSNTSSKEIGKEYESVSLEEIDEVAGNWNNERNKSVFMSFLEQRQREKTLSISDIDGVNDLPTMPYEVSTGSSVAQAPPTQCNHMCGSLFARCGSVKQEALVQTFSHPKPHVKFDDSYTGPVSLTEILQERQHNSKSTYSYTQPAYSDFSSVYDNTWGVIGSKPPPPERMCRQQELDEELDSLEKALMGNGASASNQNRHDVKNGYGLCNSDKAPVGANSDTYEYIKSGVLSLMKRETKEWENKAVDLNNEVLALQKDVKRKEQEILRLQREVHKLKSVLQQATSFSKDGDLLSTLHEVHGMAGQNVGTNNKKQGVSAESSQPNKTATDIHVKRYEKDFRSKQLIKAAIMDNDFLKNLDLSQVRELVESMYPKECSKGSYVIREGEAGAHLYVAAEGEFEVIKENKVLGRIGPGKAFGELAILYNCTRTASIRVIKDSKVWVLDRRVFQRIMMQTGLQRLEDNIHFLRSVPIFKNLCDDVLAKISDVLEVEFFPSGHHIIRQGASGDTFFILSQGSVKVTQRLQGSTEEQEIRTLERGDYFGEQALLKEDCRTASVIALPPGVECLTLDRVSFIQLIGDLSEFQEKDYGDCTRISVDNRPLSSNSIPSEPDQELAHIRLEDLDVIATLGVGGFGRVELVQCLYDKSQTFALKCMKKQHIVETHQQEHVYSEKSIMMSCRHAFICRLYRTFKDTKYVYMLMEACLGGEVWTILRDRGCFDDATCCFISACVIEALHYLHSRGIVFRDLKPENLLLDSYGYVKLVDFGFAKRLGVSSGKTWTFCGTPEYVAPEVILNKGHDKAVDCWALGILIHELLTGAPPFSGTDPMKVYNMILKGIDMVDFPRHVTRTAQVLIKKLCRDAPAERLGCQKGGLADIKKNKWFQGFDWEGLRQRTLTPPIVPQIRSPTDTANFDQYPKEIHIPEDETSNWDADF